MSTPDKTVQASVLLEKWQRHIAEEGESQLILDDYRDFGRQMLAADMPLKGLEVANAGLLAFPNDPYLQHAKGLALVRSGATIDAIHVLDELLEATPLDRLAETDPHLLQEVLGLMARTEKDAAFQATSTAERDTRLASALQYYNEAYRKTGGYWVGINVATLRTLLDQEIEAQDIAQRVYQDAERELTKSLSKASADRYWILATLGEAAMNLRNWGQAEDWYRQAYEASGKAWGNLRSTRFHLEKLIEHFGRDIADAQRWLPLPKIAIFTGHMIDEPTRLVPRFPSRLEPAVGQAIHGWLDENQIDIGFSSAARGGDILFLEAMQERGSETHIILPFGEDEFVKTSVELPGETVWTGRFNNVLKYATTVIRAVRNGTDQGPIAYEYTNELIAGSGKIKARELGTTVQGLALWDGQTGPTGGTFDAIHSWYCHGIDVTSIDLSSIEKDEGTAIRMGRVSLACEIEVVETTADDPSDVRLMSMLFADAVGYSQMNDREVRLFLEHYLPRVADLLGGFGSSILVRETAGDGLYLAFDSVSAAGQCSLDLAEMVESTPWCELGFSSPIRLRVAMHCGPIILGHDPITGLRKGVGVHVSRTARLEPKTPPGLVYASEAFAAFCELSSKLPFRCHYVKQLALAKRYGSFPTYLLRRLK